MKFFLKNIHNQKKGMTSIELVVVFSIFAALASTILFNYREFSSNIKLKNLAQDIGLQIRQTQNRSVSGSFPNLVAGQNPPPINWTPSYGLYFSKEEGENNRFISFYDYNTSAIAEPEVQNLGNKQLDDTECNFSDPNTECLDVVQIATGEFVESICLNEISYGTCEAVTDVHIVFVRPLNRAYISSSNQDLDEFGQPVFISDVVIRLETQNGRQATIGVTSTGQIIIN